MDRAGISRKYRDGAVQHLAPSATAHQRKCVFPALQSGYDTDLAGDGRAGNHGGGLSGGEPQYLPGIREGLSRLRRYQAGFCRTGGECLRAGTQAELRDLHRNERGRGDHDRGGGADHAVGACGAKRTVSVQCRDQEYADTGSGEIE